MSRPDDLQIVGGDLPEDHEPSLRRGAARWAVWAAILAVGIAAGGYGAYAHAESTEAARADLIATRVDGLLNPDAKYHRLHVPVYNAGSRDLTVLAVTPDGWPVPHGEAFEPAPVEVAAGRWATLAMAAAPACELPVPDRLTAEVRTEAGPATAAIPISPVNTLLAQVHREVCGPTDAAEAAPAIHIGWVDPAVTTPAPGVRHMELVLLADRPRIQVTAASAQAFGFRAEAIDLPVVITNPGDPVVLALRWTIEECAATRHLGDMALELAVLQDESGGANSEPVITAPAELPAWVITGLARFAGEECGP